METKSLKPLDLSEVTSNWEGGRKRGAHVRWPLEPLPMMYMGRMTEEGLRFDLGRGERYIKPPLALLPPQGPVDLGEYLLEVHCQEVVMRAYRDSEVVDLDSLTDHEVTWMEIVPPTLPSLQLVPASMLPAGIIAYLPAIRE